MKQISSYNGCPLSDVRDQYKLMAPGGVVGAARTGADSSQLSEPVSCESFGSVVDGVHFQQQAIEGTCYKLGSPTI